VRGAARRARAAKPRRPKPLTPCAAPAGAAAMLEMPGGIPYTSQCVKVMGAENLCHQAIFVNHAPSAVTSLDPDLI
jgi:hypothetical protein